jgi:hypothetical protein
MAPIAKHDKCRFCDGRNVAENRLWIHCWVIFQPLQILLTQTNFRSASDVLNCGANFVSARSVFHNRQDIRAVHIYDNGALDQFNRQHKTITTLLPEQDPL